MLGSGLPPWQASAYGFFYAMAVGVFILALVLGRRGMCNYFCPMSVVFIAVTNLKDHLQLPSLHPEADPGACIRCKKCSASCPMSLDVQGMVGRSAMQEPECIVCGNCTGSCPKGAVRLA
jgi:polyferredoxin